jgi:hypothetical protein
MLILGYANQTDVSTLSGGSWNASYPLSNLKTRYLYQTSRTANALTTSTVINIDLGEDQTIGVIALVGHNLTAETATVRIQGASNSDISPTLYDSTAQLVYTGTDYAVSFTPTRCRYWRISIVDTGNTSGYVELSRLFIGWKFAPSVTNDYGGTTEIETFTVVQQALAGPEYFDERPNRRVWRGQLSWLSETEAYRMLMVMLRQQDVSREVYLIEDDADLVFRDQRNFLGRMRSLSSIEYPYPLRRSAAIEVAEIL